VKAETWREALTRTRRAAFGRLGALLGASQLPPDFWDQLEAALIQADLGPGVTQALMESMRRQAIGGMPKVEAIRQSLRDELLRRLPSTPASEPGARPWVVMVVGVNGSGKTTTVARLARRWQRAGYSVLLAAADTYRAAAGQQLALWGERLGLEVIAGQSGGDPGAVVYDAAQAATARQIDVLIVDTSGRMHTRHNLMAELQKICRVAGKVIPGAPHQVLLVLDATTGQNGISQAKAFADTVGVTGVVLAKLDSSARGGVGFVVASDLRLPLAYVGLGEGLEDLEPFDAEAYVDGLLSEDARGFTPPAAKSSAGQFV
jgi:fused signal recognition particle receptor